MKHRTGTTFTHRLTAERTCSTLTIGVPTFIQFVVASVAPVAFCQCCCAYSALHSYLSNAAHIRCRFEQRTRILYLHSFPVTKFSCSQKSRVLALPSSSPPSLTEYIFSDRLKQPTVIIGDQITPISGRPSLVSDHMLHAHKA